MVCVEDIAVTGMYSYFFRAKVIFYSELDGGYDERQVYTNSVYVSIIK